jgi:hypothetical protein
MGAGMWRFRMVTMSTTSMMAVDTPLTVTITTRTNRTSLR